jgi:hypothetical protein
MLFAPMMDYVLKGVIRGILFFGGFGALVEHWVFIFVIQCL